MKIDKRNLSIIIERLNKGETFTSIANEYGVKAWTIQKRVSMYHPTGGKNTSAIWDIVPNYMDGVKLIYIKYKNFIKDVNLFDIVLDTAYSFTVNEVEKIEKSEKPFWRYHDILQAKVYMKKIKPEIKKEQFLYCSFQTF